MNRSAVLLVLLAGCFPQPQPQPQYPASQQTQAGTYQYTNDPMYGACQQQAATYLSVCQSILATGKNTNSGWELRGYYDSVAKTCPAHAHEGIPGNFEKCVVQLEAFELKEDPDAPKRREAAKPRVAATREKPDFKALISAWTEALDGKNITCRNREVSDSHARECERWHGEMDKVEAKLEKYLVGEGYDRRDFRPLGLWPQDPDWRTSPN